MFKYHLLCSLIVSLCSKILILCTSFVLNTISNYDSCNTMRQILRLLFIPLAVFNISIICIIILKVQPNYTTDTIFIQYNFLAYKYGM